MEFESHALDSHRNANWRLTCNGRRNFICGLIARTLSCGSQAASIQSSIRYSNGACVGWTEESVAGLRRVALAVAMSGCAAMSWGQTPAVEPPNQQPVSPPQTATPPSTPLAVDSTPGKKIYTVPSGTRVLLQLRSAVNTKSAKPGDGVYLASTFPVVVGTRVMIPAGVYVQGTVDRVIRAGRVKGRAQLDMHFTSIIFPNGTVVEIPGMVNSLPGAKKQSVKNDGEGTIEQDSQKGRNAAEVAKIAIPTGGTIGSIGGLEGGHPVVGGIVGIAAGLAATGIVWISPTGARWRWFCRGRFCWKRRTSRRRLRLEVSGLRLHWCLPRISRDHWESRSFAGRR
jgi:hypothetical protein